MKEVMKTMRRDFGSDDVIWEFAEGEPAEGLEGDDIPPDYKAKVDKYLGLAFKHMFQPDPLQELKAKLIQLALVLDFAKEYQNLTPAIAETLLQDDRIRPFSPREEKEITGELNEFMEGEELPDDMGDLEQYISSLVDKL
ncbi:MAG: hypothetical protein QW815_01875 [Nitrososphaerota archaeon]